MKHFVLAPDSFKGTMDANEVCAIWSEVIRANIPDAQIACFPMADGGEGMVDALVHICGGKRLYATVSGPMGKHMQAAYGILQSGVAVIEMAACAGLPLVGNNKNPLIATTYGVGELLLDATKHGVKEVIIGLGGSATNDCGIGMAAALGYRFLNMAGREVEPLAKNMRTIAHIVPPDAIPKMTITAACDVDNPLYGPTGATYTFGMQKGAEGNTLALLDDGLVNMAEVILRDLGTDVAQMPGAGAAGGMGAGVVAFLNGSLKSGIDLLLDAANFNAALKKADMVFTGEGRIDGQSVRGKVPVGISRRAKKFGIPCIALCGSIGDGVEKVYDEGINAVFAAVKGACTFDQIKETCHDDMRQLADAVVRTLCI